MRKQILGATALLLGTGALTLATPPAPAQAAGWTHTDDITGDAATNVISRVMDVVGYGDGFAGAVWFETADAVRHVSAARFLPNVNGGQWSSPEVLSTPGRSTYDPVIDVNDNGDLVAAWTETHDGVEELYAAVQPVGGAWSAPRLLTPGATNVFPGIDVGIANDKTVYAAASYTDADDTTFGVRVVEWEYPAVPDAPLMVAADGRFPSIDVSGTGETILAFKNEAQDLTAFTRHSPGGPWKAAQSVGGATTPPPAAGINDAGQAAIAFVNSVGYTLQVQRVAPDGSKHGAPTTLSTNVPLHPPALDVNEAGRLLVAWPDADNGPLVGHATSSFGGSWTIAAEPAPTAKVEAVDAEVAETGAQAIGYADGGTQVVLHRRRPTDEFTQRLLGGGYADVQATSIDKVGNVVALGALTGGKVTLHARYLDTVGPTTAVDEWPIGIDETGLVLTDEVPFKAVGFDWLSGLESVDVVARVAAWNEGTYGPRKVLTGDQPAYQPIEVAPAPGRSYCVGVRGTDGVGNLGVVTVEHCFTTPLDDRTFKATGWRRLDGAAHYRGTVTTTKAKGRVLVHKGVRAQHLALVVAKAANGGKVRVQLGQQVLGTFSLKGVGPKQVIDVADFAHVRKGTLRITVVSKGRPVRIDGVVIAK